MSLCESIGLGIFRDIHPPLDRDDLVMGLYRDIVVV